MTNKSFWICFAILAMILFGASFVLTYDTYHMPPPENSSNFLEAGKIFLLCLGGIGVVLTAYFSAANIAMQRKQSVIENTFSLLSQWDDTHFFEARRVTRQMKYDKNFTEEELISRIKYNEDLKQSVILIINYLEHVRFSLKTGRVDNKIFYQSLGETLIDIANRFKSYAETINVQSGKDLQELIDILSDTKKHKCWFAIEFSINKCK